jgi:hypothetical protein
MCDALPDAVAAPMQAAKRGAESALRFAGTESGSALKLLMLMRFASQDSLALQLRLDSLSQQPLLQKVRGRLAPLWCAQRRSPPDAFSEMQGLTGRMPVCRSQMWPSLQSWTSFWGGGGSCRLCDRAFYLSASEGQKALLLSPSACAPVRWGLAFGGCRSHTRCPTLHPK